MVQGADSTKKRMYNSTVRKFDMVATIHEPSSTAVEFQLGGRGWWNISFPEGSLALEYLTYS